LASHVENELGEIAGLFDTQEARVARRIAELDAADEQFRAAQPIREVVEAVRRPGLRLPQLIDTLMVGYAERPAVGQRARELVQDPTTGRTSARLLPWFDTISYRELWEGVATVATAWRNDPDHPVNPGDVIATLGSASPDYLTIDLVCAYLGVVAVPLQHNAPAPQLQPIIDEVEPRLLAVSPTYLDVAVEFAVRSASLRHLVVFDYQSEVDDHRDALARARERVQSAGVLVKVETLHEIVERGQALPPEAFYVGGTSDRLAMILYTSGSTGAPKGAMYTEAMLSVLWAEAFVSRSDAPVFEVNFMPLNHLGGRLPLISAFRAGGTNHFVAKPDLSSLFEDWAIVRPTEIALVPRVVEMLFQRYRSAVDRIHLEGADRAAAEQEAADEIREQVLGGRALSGFVSTAPLAEDMRQFIESVLRIHAYDIYGLTELGGVLKDGLVQRPPVTDYKLVDVPELGYFLTDKPHPRGELLVKSQTAMPGYYKRPDITAQVFDADGYYRTGDVMAEVEPDHLLYVDRRNNVLKLAQGEFVAVANLEALFAGAPLVRQIFVYGNSERSHLLAVIVPGEDALKRHAGDELGLRTALGESLQQTAKAAELQSYELPADFLIETEPFTMANGLLSGVGKLLRPKLIAHYGQRLEELYAELAAVQVDELRTLRQHAADRPVVETLARAAGALLGSAGTEAKPDVHFTDMGGDSLSALTFSQLLHELFGVEVPVGVIIGPTATLSNLAKYVEDQRDLTSPRPTFTTVHGADASSVHAGELTLDAFIDAETLVSAKTLPDSTGEPRSVLLTGANGYLGRFLALEWLQRLSQTGGILISIVRGSDPDAARARLEAAFDSGDPQLLRQFRELAAKHLEVVIGDIGEPNLGLDQTTWDRLSRTVDLIVHPAALVNHVLPYDQLFGPNVVGTAEVIRLAISARIKPVTYLSTVAVAMSVPPETFQEDGDIRAVSPVRLIDDSYANGYGNSKWAGEVLLREAHELCGLPVAVFRSDMILAHSRYLGQLNVPDAFTRLIFSLIVTGIAPKSFYRGDGEELRPRAHYSGLPVDFVAESIVTLGIQAVSGYRTYDVMSPHDDGVSLDTFVDWLSDAGHAIQRIDDYHDWLTRFETVLRALPETRRQHTLLPLLGPYREPAQPLRGAPAPTDVYQSAVRAAKIGADEDIPHLSADLIDKYVKDLEHVGLL
jgi:fatty acid CoA ligase FadD9